MSLLAIFLVPLFFWLVFKVIWGIFKTIIKVVLSPLGMLAAVITWFIV
jgi:predicted Na+-dependent transporter